MREKTRSSDRESSDQICLEESPFISKELKKKLSDLQRNHKFRGGLLGIKRLVETTFTTSGIYTTSGNRVTTAAYILPLLM